MEIQTANSHLADCAVDAGEGSEGRFPIFSSALSFGYGDGEKPTTSVGKGLYRVSTSWIWGEDFLD